MVPCPSTFLCTATIHLRHTHCIQDHTEFETALNVYMGQDGFYLLSDDQEKELRLPAGSYDIPLSLSAKEYGSDGSLVYNTRGDNGLLGDVIQV
jgi:bilirubin oxidase